MTTSSIVKKTSSVDDDISRGDAVVPLVMTDGLMTASLPRRPAGGGVWRRRR